MTLFSILFKAKRSRKIFPVCVVMTVAVVTFIEWINIYLSWCVDSSVSFGEHVFSQRWLMGCLHDLANSSKLPANVFKIHVLMLDVCWTFAGSCRRSIRLLCAFVRHLLHLHISTNSWHFWGCCVKLIFVLLTIFIVNLFPFGNSKHIMDLSI